MIMTVPVTENQPAKKETGKDKEGVVEIPVGEQTV
jgi:hypothetical protein